MTSLVRRVHRPLLRRVFPEFDRVFGDLWLRPLAGRPTLAPRAEQVWAPRVDVYEKDGEIVTEVELPGVAKEDVAVVRDDGHLVIRAETKKDDKVEEEGYYRRERFQGRFERAIPLPVEVEDEEIKAKFEDGVLEVRAPRKQPEPTGRKIDVS